MCCSEELDIITPKKMAIQLLKNQSALYILFIGKKSWKE